MTLYDRYGHEEQVNYVPMAADDGPLPPPKHRGQAAPPSESPPGKGLLAALRLDDLDTGDLLLLALLFFLFRQNADEELLMAIGLLLIM